MATDRRARGVGVVLVLVGAAMVCGFGYGMDAARAIAGAVALDAVGCGVAAGLTLAAWIVAAVGALWSGMLLLARAAGVR